VNISDRRVAVVVLVVFACVGAALYANAWRNPFVFDDTDAIVGSPNVRHLWPLQVACGAPAGSGASGRPLVALSLAVNYALGGLDPRGYRIFNVMVHVLAAWVAFLLVRGTLRLSALAPRFGAHAGWFAFAVALVWLVHPVHTAAIDHVVYRNETMAALGILAVLECVRRAATTSRAHAWSRAAIVACLGAVASKEVAVVAPVLAYLYDAVFLAGSFGAAWKARARLYLVLAATWVPLSAFVAAGDRGASVGFGFEDVTPFAYARTQIGVVVHYLKLVFWPRPLILDDAWPVAKSWGAVAPQLVLLVALAAVTILMWKRRRPLAFLGAWWCLLLAPTSSFVPLTGAIAADHRVVLPSLAPLALVVLAIGVLGAGRARSVPVLALLAAIVVACGIVVRQRNREFADEVALWTATLAHRPDNPRAQNNLGAALVLAERTADAVPHFDAAIRVSPRYAPAHRNRGSALVRLGRAPEALPSLRAAIDIDPNDALSHYKLGQALHVLGDRAAAIAAYQRAIALQPDLVMAHHNLGVALLEQGNRTAARAAFTAALAQDPDHVGSLNNLAWLLATSPEDVLRDGAAAVRTARHAAQLTGERDPQILDTLAAALAEAGDFAAADTTLGRALALSAQNPRAPHERLTARRALYRSGRAYRMGM